MIHYSNRANVVLQRNGMLRIEFNVGKDGTTVDPVTTIYMLQSDAVLLALALTQISSHKIGEENATTENLRSVQTLGEA